MQTTIKNSVLLGAGLLGLAGVAQAAELTANVGVTSNYVFRGATQTDDNPAVQGGVDYIHEVGVYAGAWASNVDNGFDSGFETDLYVGYNFKLNENVTFDVGYITYQYSSINTPDSDEIFFGASFKDFSATYYRGDRDVPVNSDYSYIDLKYSYALPEEFVLHLHYGLLNDDNEDAEDASIGVSKNILDFDVGLTITTIDYDGGTQDEDEIFITVNKAFQIM